MEPTTILVARQAGTQWHDNEQVIGKQDAELSMPGLRRAEMLAKDLSGRDIDIVYTSSLGRAIDTGKAVAKYHGLKVIPHNALDEQGLGILEGKKKKEVAKELKRLQKKDDEMSGVENRYDFEKRVIGFLEKCLHDNEGKIILLVSHEGPVKVIQRYFTRFDTTKNDDSYKPPLAGISEFKIKNLEPMEVGIEILDESSHIK